MNIIEYIMKNGYCNTLEKLAQEPYPTPGERAFPSMGQPAKIPGSGMFRSGGEAALKGGIAAGKGLLTAATGISGHMLGNTVGNMGKPITGGGILGGLAGKGSGTPAVPKIPSPNPAPRPQMKITGTPVQTNMQPKANLTGGSWKPSFKSGVNL